jgi:hypothetical protein
LLPLGGLRGRNPAFSARGGARRGGVPRGALPRGRDRAESTHEVSAALKTLEGTKLESVTLAAVAPGAFTLTIDAGGVSASVRLDASGARLTSLGT